MTQQSPPFDAEAYLRASTQIDELIISEEFIRLPADVSYWNSMYAEAYRQFLIAEFDRKQSWANALSAARVVLADKGLGGARGPTVDAVEAEAMRDPNFVKAKRWEIQCESDKVRLAGVLEALRTKKDMLISYGANQRAEMQQELYSKGG